MHPSRTFDRLVVSKAGVIARCYERQIPLLSESAAEVVELEMRLDS